MSTSRQKKQTRILYFCFLIFLITVSVAAAVTGGFRKSESSRQPIPESVDQGESAGTRAPESTERDRREAGLIPKKPAASEKETEPEPVPTEPTAAEPEPIKFTLPVSGTLYASFSDAVPVFSPTMNDFRTHNGVDVAANAGDPVTACADGVIAEIWDDPMMGKSMRIDHGDGFESVYRNLAAELPEGIAAGTVVRAGQTVAAVGTTALIECEDEPHLHFELRSAGRNVDPAEYMVFSPAATEYEG